MTWSDEDLAAALKQRFLLREPIGRGACGVVFRAEQVSLARTVALKVLSPSESASAEFLVERFPVEARAAARISHPNVVKVYDHGVLPGALAYIVYEFIEGDTLASLLGGRPIRPAARARRLAAHLAAGVAALHEAGILHRDIKPANILVDRQGVARLIDLGLARDVVDQAYLTRTGMVLGTPAYTPPEYLVRGELATAADVYSLGAVLYELVTGQPPFPGLALSELVSAHVSNPPRPPAEVVRDADPLLSELALAALAKDPAARPAAAAVAATLADSLEDAAPEKPRRPASRLSARHVSPVAAPPPAARRRTPILAATALSIALAAAVVVARTGRRAPAQQPSVPLTVPSASAPPASRPPSPDPDAQPLKAARGEIAHALEQVAATRTLSRSAAEAARPSIAAAMERAVRAYESLPAPHRRELWGTTEASPGLFELVRTYCAAFDDDAELEWGRGGMGAFFARAGRVEGDTPLYFSARGLYHLTERPQRAPLAPALQTEREEAFHDLYLGLNLALRSPGAGPALAIESALAVTKPRHEWRRRAARASEIEWPLWRLFHAHGAERAARRAGGAPAAVASRLTEALADYHRKLQAIGAMVPAPDPPDWSRHLSGATGDAADGARARLDELTGLAREPARWRAEVESDALADRMGALIEALRPLDGAISTPVLQDIERWLASAAEAPRGPPGYWLARATWLSRIGRAAEARVAGLAGLESAHHAPSTPSGLVVALYEGILDAIPPAKPEAGEAEGPDAETALLYLQQATVAERLAGHASEASARDPALLEIVVRARVWEARLLAHAGHAGLADRARSAAQAALTEHGGRLDAAVVADMRAQLGDPHGMKAPSGRAILPSVDENR